MRRSYHEIADEIGRDCHMFRVLVLLVAPRVPLAAILPESVPTSRAGSRIGMSGVWEILGTRARVQRDRSQFAMGCRPLRARADHPRFAYRSFAGVGGPHSIAAEINATVVVSRYS